MHPTTVGASKTTALRSSPPLASVANKKKQTTTAVGTTAASSTSKCSCSTQSLMKLLVGLVVLSQCIILPYLVTTFLHRSSLSTHEKLSNFKQQGGDFQRQRRLPAPAGDGTFNGAPIYFQTKQKQQQQQQQQDEKFQFSKTSKVHCVGENYDPTGNAWQQRSCRFHFLCFNTTARDFVLYQSPSDLELEESYLTYNKYMHFSTSMNEAVIPVDEEYNTNNNARRIRPRQAVSLGGINLQWGVSGIPRVKWFPAVKSTDELPDTYYTLPDNVVMVPFHSQNGANPGHLVWDDFLPIYTLLDMFGLLPLRDDRENDQNDYEVLLIRYILTNGERGLWASCDLRDEKTAACNKMIKKFLPLFTGKSYPYNFSTTADFQFVPNDNNNNGRTTELVCATHGVAGIGALTDHGLHKSHGWRAVDYTVTHNHGRGSMVYRFRNYMMKNLGISTPVNIDPRPAFHKIVVSERSSDIPARNIDFTSEKAFLQQALGARAQVEGYVFKEMTLQEQMQLISDASVFITACGGGAVTGMFLPRGAAMVVYYAENGGAENNRMTLRPALLDWDLFNSMTHIRVHWMPRNTRKTALDLNALARLIHQELDLIESEAFA